jgi:hypothetical protein
MWKAQEKSPASLIVGIEGRIYTVMRDSKRFGFV